jgi:hypothetical protein
MLGWDANEALDLLEDSHVERVILECGLGYVHTHRHGGLGPATHARGSKRIDFFLVSPALREYISGSP